MEWYGHTYEIEIIPCVLGWQDEWKLIAWMKLDHHPNGLTIQLNSNIWLKADNINGVDDMDEIAMCEWNLAIQV
jgi:hypothetical protein